MNDKDNDGAAVRIPPPLICVAAMALGAGLHVLWPMPLPLPRVMRTTLALAAGLPSVVLIVGAVMRFRATGQNPAPWLATPEIISTGVYRFTRNPMYLSLALMQTAIGIASSKPWVVLTVPLTCVGLYFMAIRHEEAYLERKFGATYLDYKNAVRRWL